MFESPNNIKKHSKEKSDFSNGYNLDLVVNDDQLKALSEESELLENNIIEVELLNLDSSDLEKIKKVIDIIDDITSQSHIISGRYESRLNDFINQISDVYSEEQLKKTALINVLKGEDIPEDVEYLDLEGEYSVEQFLQELINELDEGVL